MIKITDNQVVNLGLPAGYTRLEYIESTGTQWIDTNYLAINGMLLEAKGKVVSNTWFLGAYTAGSPDTSRNLINYRSSDGLLTCQKINLFSNEYGASVGSNPFTVVMDTRGTTFSGIINGAQIFNITTDTIYTPTQTVLISKDPNGTIKSGRFYYIKITNSANILVRDFVPAKNPSGVVGMYDLVSNTFFTNAGTGSFVAGPEVPTTQTTVDLKRRYITDNNGVPHEVNKVVITNNSGVPSVAWRNPDYYGVKWSTTDTTVDGVSVSKYTPIRTGRMDWHATLPIHNKMRRCILGTKSGSPDIVRYVHPDSWMHDTNLELIDYTKTYDAETGYRFDVMVEIPEHWYKAYSETINGVTWCYLNLYPYDVFDNDTNYRRVPKHYVGAFEAMLDRTNNTLYSTCKLKTFDTNNENYSLYVNDAIAADDLYTNNKYSLATSDTQWRGGDGTSYNDARTLTGRPATNKIITEFCTYAKNRNTDNTLRGGFALNHWASRCSILRLYIVEYANFNSQATYNATLTNEGYRQGGLGAGATTSDGTQWGNQYNNNPTMPCGVTLRLGSNTGTVEYSLASSYQAGVSGGKVYVPSYRGIENPFGDIWEITNGMLINAQTIYTINNNDKCDDWYIKDFVSSYDSSYHNQGKNITGGSNNNGWITALKWNADGDFIPDTLNSTGDTTTDTISPIRDYVWAQNTGYKRLLVGGGLADASEAGLFCFHVYSAVSSAGRNTGSRLLYMPVVNN